MSTHQKVSVLQLPSGAFDVYCRGCKTLAWAFDRFAADRMVTRHDACPAQPKAERR